MGDRTNRDKTVGYGGLLHPVFLGALVVLLVNDHLLKGSGLLPGDATGKLSDVAWLVVTPVAAAALTSRAGQPWRYVAAAVPVLFFVALQLVPAVATLVERTSHAAGLPMRVWPDPTDLWALLVLPVPWALMRRPTAPHGVRRKLSRASLAVASLASVGTSALPVSLGPAGILNHSEGTVTLRLRAYEGEPLCWQQLAQVARSLEGQSPVVEKEFTLSQGYVAGLPTPTDATCFELRQSQSTAPPCRLAVAELGADNRFILRSAGQCYSVDGAVRSTDYVPLYETPFDFTAVLRGKPGNYTLESRADIEVYELATDSPL